MTSSLFDDILEQVSMGTHGIIWFSEEPINEISEIHPVFDYLVDGSLKKFVRYLLENNLSAENENNFFISQSFNEPFIIFNSCLKKSFSAKDFEDFKMIMDKHSTASDKNIAVVYPKGTELPSVIKRSLSDYKEIAY